MKKKSKIKKENKLHFKDIFLLNINNITIPGTIKKNLNKLMDNKNLLLLLLK